MTTPHTTEQPHEYDDEHRGPGCGDASTSVGETETSSTAPPAPAGTVAARQEGTGARLRALADRLRISRRENAGEKTGYDTGLQLAHVIGHLTITRSGTVTAWYTAAPQRWSFRSDGDRNHLLSAHARRLSELAGRRIHLRVTHRPYPVHLWAQALHAEALDPLPGWTDYLAEEQHAVAGGALSDKVVFYGIEAGRLSGLGRAALHRGGASDLEVLSETLDRVDQTMAAPGMDAGPATPEDMDWLMSRSVGLGLPAPVSVPRPSGRWDAEDLAEFTDGVEWASPAPFAPHTLISGERAGERVERHVSVSTVGQMDLHPIPESGLAPWLQRLDRLPWPTEVSATFDIREGAEASAEILDQLQRVRAQIGHHHEHGIDTPLSLDRQGQIGYQAEDDVRSNLAGLATRVQGWVRIAVSGKDAREARDRTAALHKALAPHLVLHRPIDQYRLAREFIPGEPLANQAHRRRMPVTTLAGALPAASAEVGDKNGPRLGHTSGITRRAVMWHPWRSQEVREGSGLTPVASTLGGGKTVLCGSVVYNTARMGAPWVVLDPSGPVTKLCDLAELRPFSRAINLMNAEPGTLNPFRIIPDPDPAHYTARQYQGDEDQARTAFHRAVVNAAAQRRTLATDVLAGLLPSQITASEATQTALMIAASKTEATVHASPRDMLDALRTLDGAEMYEHGQRLARLLEQAAELPQGQLIFPAAGGGDDRYQTENHRLVVMSLRGLTLPAAGSDRSDWSLEEQYSMPLLYLAGWYAQRSIYARSMRDRKGLWLDEAHELLRVSSGRALLRKTGRDSRKHNVRALYATQDADDLLTAGISNWVDAAFVGRTVGADAQRAALRLLDIEPGCGYEDVLAGLSRRTRGAGTSRHAREFVMSDGDGGIERITVTLDHRPGLREALDSTARPHDGRTESGPFTGGPFAGPDLTKAARDGGPS